MATNVTLLLENIDLILRFFQEVPEITKLEQMGKKRGAVIIAFGFITGPDASTCMQPSADNKA